MSLHDLFKGLMFLHGYVNPADKAAIAALQPNASARTSVAGAADDEPALALQLNACTGP